MKRIQDNGKLEAFCHQQRDLNPWFGRYPWQLLSYHRREFLCRFGEPVQHLIVLLEGTVTVSLTTPHARTHVLTYCQAGELICGDVEVALGNTLATADLQVFSGQALCAQLELDAYRGILLQDNGFLRYAFQRLAREMVKDSVYTTNNLLYRLEERLAAYIVEAAQDGLFQENLSRTAELLGVSYRQLSRVMRTFRDRGWLVKTDSGWRIQNLAALQAQGENIKPLDFT